MRGGETMPDGSRSRERRSGTDAGAHEVLVVGAGFGGMGIGIALDRLGIHDFRIVDRERDVGGTWHVNRYPGLAVDIASTTYSFSFEPNPRWSRLYARGPELERYAQHVARKYRLYGRMEFERDVTAATWDEATRTWTLHFARHPPMRGRVLVLATGYLAQPKFPDIPGLGDFRGTVIHTARWDASHDFDGERVALIGTGATAVQLLPELADRVRALDVYQRTAIWVSPKYDPAIPPAVQGLFARLPVSQRIARHATSTVLELAMVTSTLYYREFPGLARAAERACRAHLRRQIPDPALRERLTPDYPFGCKRPTFSNDFYPTFLRPHVSLVTDGIARVEADAIVTAEGRRRPIDTLVLATGYKVWEPGNFPAFPVHGTSEVELGARWRAEGYESYDGITVHGYPNFFYTASPYSFTGLSYFFAIESQMKHVARCLTEVRRRGATRFEARAEAQAAFMRMMRERAHHTIIATGQCQRANTYYLNPHGESSLLRLMPTPVALYRAGRFDLDDYAYA